MPVSVVVGGQFGSEGKGKVALEIARRTRAAIVVRVGGTNSGHTAIDQNGKAWALRQLPVSVLAAEAIAVLPAGAIIDPDIFLSEISALKLDPYRVVVSPYSTLISEADKNAERSENLPITIGSTGSGTGSALIRRTRRRHNEQILAHEHPSLHPYIRDTGQLMRQVLNREGRIVIEGSQGFGLSLLNGGFYPFATSRDTTASTFVGEAGLSPLDVDDVTLVIRAYPIRVAGNSGPLKGETTWVDVAKSAGLPEGYCELTTATRNVRRVAAFDPETVKRAIDANNPSRLVLNHFDYVDSGIREHRYNPTAVHFLRQVEESIGRRVDWVGTGPALLVDRSTIENSPQQDAIRAAV